LVFRGLKFLSDAEIGEKDSFRPGTSYKWSTLPLKPDLQNHFERRGGDNHGCFVSRPAIFWIIKSLT
jgi:hypothetical protein